MPRFPMDPSEPTYRALDALLSGIHTSMPATVRSYDRATQTGVFRPAVRRPIVSAADEDEDIYEVLPDVGCPVVWLRGAGAFLHTGLSAGDGVVLVFSQADFAAYRATGKAGDPKDNRVFSAGAAMAIPGMFSRAQAIGGLSSDLELGFEDGLRLRLNATALGVGVDPASVLPTVQQVAVADLVNLFIEQLKIALPTSVPTLGVGAQIATAITAAITAMSAPGTLLVGPGPFGSPKVRL